MGSLYTTVTFSENEVQCSFVPIVYTLATIHTVHTYLQNCMDLSTISYAEVNHNITED